MSRAAVGELLGLLLLLAGLGALLSTAAPARDAGGAPLVTDAQTAWRLRRVALALATRRLEQVDSALTHPETQDALDLPVHDELWALVARGVTGGAVGGPGEAVDLELLERLAILQGPALGLLLVLTVHLLLRQVGGAGRGATLAATLLAAGGPVALATAAPGVIRIELTAAVLLVVGLRLMLEAFAAPRPLDRFTVSLLAGGVLGLGLALTPHFLLPAAAAHGAFLRAAARAPEGEREDLGRSFLLFWIALVLGGLVPALGGPWLPAAEGLVRGWTHLVSELALLLALPFVLLRLAPRRVGPWLAGIAAELWALALLAVGGTLLLLAGPDHPRTALLSASLGLGPDGPVRLPGGLELAALVPLVAASVGLRRLPDGPRRDLLTGLVLLAGGVGVVHPPALLFAAVPAGLGLAALPWGPRRLAPWLAAGAGLLSLAFGITRAGAPGPTELEVVRAARELLVARGPAAGWWSPRAVERGAVLSGPEVGPLVVWHARWPVTTLGVTRNGDPGGRARLEELLGVERAERALASARDAGVRFVLLGPGAPVGALATALEAEAPPGAVVPAGAGPGQSRFLDLAAAPPPGTREGRGSPSASPPPGPMKR